MQCSNCQVENHEGANFCNNCGGSLQSNLERSDKISKADSNPTSPSKQIPSQGAATISGERKHMTILFSDLTGYTDMSEKLDPEELKEITTPIFEGIAQIIEKHNGFVEKYIGDAVMAVFGATKSREDDPYRAIKAAVEIHELVHSFRSGYEHKIGHTLAMHSGVNTGLVVTGDLNLEKGTHGLVGDTINLAARICGLSNANDILVGPNTFFQTKRYFNFDTLPPARVKGKVEPVRLYRVRSIIKHPVVTKGIEDIETKTIGRDSELQCLRGTFHKTMEKGDTRVITVVGEAGIGKSRLLYEFNTWLETLPDAIHLIKARSTPDDRHSTHGLWKNLFTVKFGIELNDGTDQVMRKFRRNMEDVLEQDQADLVGHFVGFDFSRSRAVKNLLGSQAFEAMAFANLTIYLRSVSKSQTVILLDDIHFADDGSIDILERITKAIPDAPMMIVCMTRPILYEQRSHWGESQHRHQLIKLRPLSKRSSRMLIEEITKSTKKIPDTFRTQIVDTAEGNPFYLEELINMLVEDGVIIHKEGGHGLDNVTNLKVPTTLTGVLQARLDALSEKQKCLLQRASIIGRLFWDLAVSQLVADENDRISRYELQALLENARHREMIFERERSNIFDSRAFVFKHALLRDVAYGTVLLKRRKIYHRQAAEWFVKTVGERIDEYTHLIGSHYELAGENLKAVKYLRKTGETLYKKNAYQQAIYTLERALRLLPDDALKERAEVEVTLGEVNTDKGEYSQARVHLTHVLEKYEKFLSSRSLVTAQYRLGWIYSKMGEYESAIKYAERGLVVARTHNDTYEVAQCLHTKGWIYFLIGKFSHAVKHAREALNISQDIGDKRSISLSLNVIQAASAGMGQYEEAIKINEECINIGREIGDQLVISRGLCNHGEHYRKQCKYPEAIRCYQESLEISRQLDQKNLICITLNNLGFALTQLQSFNDAQHCFCESVALALDIEAPTLALHSVAGIAEIFAYNNKPVDSAELIGMVSAHPMSTHEDTYETDRILAVLRKIMSESELNSALNRGKGLDANAVFRDSLSTSKIIECA